MSNVLVKNLEEYLNEKAKVIARSKPIFFDLDKVSDTDSLKKLASGRQIQYVINDYQEQLHELFAVENPSIVHTPNFESEFADYLLKLKKLKPFLVQGKWVYFPWCSTLTHILDDKQFQTVRTARNRNLINREEQEKFYNSVIGIGGLSIGNSVALAIVLQGGAKHIRLADFDRLALSNINRIRAGVDNLGLAKVEITARQIYIINPYAQVELFPDGLTKKNIKKFFSGPPKLDIVIDELDNLAIKYLVREQAKRHKIAVVMAADNGDNGVVDVERYDLDPKIQFFHGRMGKVSYQSLLHLDKFGIGKMITKHVGPENVTERMQNSLLEIGKTVVSWPQLGGVALLNGSAVAYCVRKILNSQPLEKNRAIISLDEKLIPDYHSSTERKKRTRTAQVFRKIFNL